MTEYHHNHLLNQNIIHSPDKRQVKMTLSGDAIERRHGGKSITLTIDSTGEQPVLTQIEGDQKNRTAGDFKVQKNKYGDIEIGLKDQKITRGWGASISPDGTASYLFPNGAVESPRGNQVARVYDLKAEFNPDGSYAFNEIVHQTVSIDPLIAKTTIVQPDGKYSTQKGPEFNPINRVPDRETGTNYGDKARDLRVQIFDPTKTEEGKIVIQKGETTIYSTTADGKERSMIIPGDNGASSSIAIKCSTSHPLLFWEEGLARVNGKLVPLDSDDLKNALKKEEGLLGRIANTLQGSGIFFEVPNELSKNYPYCQLPAGTTGSLPAIIPPGDTPSSTDGNKKKAR